MNRKLRQVNANDADAGEQLALEAHTALMIAGD
jgi:hypothetical protein